MSLIQARNKNNLAEDITQGFGLGIRQHDDIMLAYGYSRVASYNGTLPAGDFLILRLDVNDVLLHHLESRLIGSSASSLRLKLYDVTGNENLFPATPVALDIYNQKFLTKETIGVDVQAGLYSHPIQQVDPFTGLDDITNIPIYTPSVGGQINPTSSVTLRGRHYKPNSVYAISLENIGNASTKIYYQYDWHEISV